MKELFLQIKNNIDIVEVISNYISLTPSGNYFKGLSPFQLEKTASFTVTPEKKIFYCFSSNIGGDVIDFVSRIENCTQYQAAMLLIQKYNLVINKKLIFTDTTKTEEKDNYFKIYSIFVLWGQQQIINNITAQKYLIERGIKKFWQEHYSIGYCPSSIFINDFLEIIKKESILINDVIKTNIIQKKGNKLFFTCQERIIFPISNVLQLYCAYGARIINNSNTQPKYINSITTNEFTKKNILYGLSQAKKKIKETKIIYLVEGYFDTILMAQSGYENTVATMGTAMNSHHIDYIKKLVDIVIIVYDGDQAGKNALIKSVGLFWNESIDVYIVLLPENEDPASLCQKKIINQYIDNKISIIDFFISEKKTLIENNSLKSIHDGLYDIIQAINNIKDETKKMSIILKISQKLELHPDFFKPSIKNIQNKQNNEIQAKKIIVYNNKDKNPDKNKEKEELSNWYLFFYMTLYFYNSQKIFTLKSIFLIKQFGPNKILPIIEAFLKENQKTNLDFIDFFKIYHEKIYTHCIKIMSIYHFSFEQYKIIYQKILKLSWIKYKNENNNAIFKKFLSQIP